MTGKKISLLLSSIIFFIFFVGLGQVIAGDTDIYMTNLRPNVAIMFDSSGSMDFGIYDYTVDYGGFYNYASEQGDYDLIAGGGGGTNNRFYAAGGPGTPPQYPRTEILLLKGNIGVTIRNGRSYTGDPGDPDYIWYVSNVVHTYTYIDANGNFSGDGNHTQRLTTAADGTILLDGVPLPLDRSIKLHDWQPNPDGTLIDKGFGGQINAPGWYFSGMEGIGSGAAGHNTAEDGDINVFFFITGNWINMQMVYNLYTDASGNESNRTWKVRTYSNVQWHTVFTNISSPNYPANYPNNYDTTWEIVQPDATQIRLHFTNLKMQSPNKDNLKIYVDDLTTSNLQETLGGSMGSDFWTGPYTLGASRNLWLAFHTNRRHTYKGFHIDKYQYLRADEITSGYKMQRRIDAVREAILYVIDATRGKINWALTSFETSPHTGDGAHIWQPFNPTLDDDAVRQNIVTHIKALEPEGGTPLGEAMEDVFNHFENKAGLLPECTRNYTIVISDGFPSDDDDWSRVSGKTFTDADGDGWTEDPYQYSTPPDDYFDDVAHFMYTTSFRDRTTVADPSSSYDNITSHMLSFIQGIPLLENAADEAGGIYLAAYNKQQLINAFYSLGLLIIKSTSYVAPVISVDTSNKTQSGEYLYMAFFKPKDQQWSGNLKKYRLEKKIKSSCAARTEKEEWVPMDQNGIDAVNCDGTFIETSVSYWSTENDGGEVELGGVGEVLKTALDGSDLTNPYTYRHIYVLKNSGTNTIFDPDHISNADLGAADDVERYKIINYIYGYTYDEDGSSHHYPTARRSWPLGSLVHSNPTVINYEADNKTFIVIGGNDGMLHVFDDSTGTEKAAFVLENQLKSLKLLDPGNLAAPKPLYYVDGPITFYYTFDGDGKITPQQLIVGERRGGRAYYSLDISSSDPTSWTKSWVINSGISGFGELGQSWSKIKLAKLKTSASTEKMVGIFSAGYDPVEDSIPAGTDTMGRGLFVVDVNQPETSGTFLVHSVSYSANPAESSHRMTYAIAADPTVITDGHGYLSDIFFADLGGQIWKLSYNNTSFSWNDPQLIFTANPGSNAASGLSGGSLLTADKGRKMFYSPAVTLLGNCNYVDSSGTTHDYQTYMLFAGTGDREKPKSTNIHDRIYALVDAAPAGTTLNESDLTNVTDDELDIDSGETAATKTTIQTTLSKSYGWYIKLDEIPDLFEHEGEKILSQPVIFFGKTYFTSYTPLIDDPCRPHGEAKVYGLNYCDGTAGLNYNLNNDVISGADRNKKFDKTDRYQTIGEAIPSGVKIVIRKGKVAAFISVGGKLTGAGVANSPNIPQPSFAIDMINWQEMIGQ